MRLLLRPTLVGTLGYIAATVAMWGALSGVSAWYGMFADPGVLLFAVPLAGLGAFQAVLHFAGFRSAPLLVWGGGVIVLYGTIAVMVLLRDAGVVSQDLSITGLFALWLLLAIVVAHRTARKTD